MTTTNLCRIHVRFGENEIELEGDRDFVQEAFRDFKDGFFTVPVTQQVQVDKILSLEGEVKPASDLAAPSLAGFLRELGVKSHPDISIAMAVYFYQYRHVETFTKADIENGYREALLSKSRNFSQDINRNRKKGYMDITGEKRDGLATFHVTQQGIDYVNSFNDT